MVDYKMVDYKLDALGQRCPIPIINAKKIMKKMKPGEILEIIADDMGAKADVPALVKKTGDILLESREEGKKLIFLVKKN